MLVACRCSYCSFSFVQLCLDPFLRCPVTCIDQLFLQMVDGFLAASCVVPHHDLLLGSCRHDVFSFRIEVNRGATRSNVSV